MNNDVSMPKAIGTPPEAFKIALDVLSNIGAKKVLDWIKSGEVEIFSQYVKIPSPMSLNLLLQGHTDLMRIEDKQDFLKRMHKLYMQEIEKKANPEYIYGDFQAVEV